MLWAFASTGWSNASLFLVFAIAAQRCVAVFKPQELVNVAWASAKFRQNGRGLFASLTKGAVQQLNEFKQRELANAAWAFGVACQSAPELFRGLMRQATKYTEEFDAQDLRMTLWALSCRESLRDALSLLDHVDFLSIRFSQVPCGSLRALLMHGEQLYKRTNPYG
eukprot:gnl/TRDRNA2_/TRDRNA2_168233_c3_seq1.p2 gnl/TRDRNA2_/TRDRNA2_168233_c3~~gnl/TRDRNA2_/TRDRNA2_168233_c3_seq1.p2  ORF type:complete len:166 (+),score=24.73 gnl/TRDRNA2_/TRDRNA2_168233_c3_seq1:119-616(+)